MALAARAAAVRGDDLQYLRAWEWTVRALHDNTIQSITVEDPGAGSFDDIVIRREDGRIRFEQVKSSNFAETALSFAALTASRPAGKSLLQHLFQSWRDNRGAGNEFALLSNRSLDPNEPVLATRDNLLGKLDSERIRTAGSRTRLGRALTQWADHCGTPVSETIDFLTEIEVRTFGTDYPDSVRSIQKLAGLRDSHDALEAGRALPKRWVTEGAGAQTRDSIKRQVSTENLLALGDSVRLDVYAIDRRESAMPATVEVDLREFFATDIDPRHRHALLDHRTGATEVIPRLQRAVSELDAYGVRKVEVGGAMRLPYWFMTGRALPEVRGWQLSTEQSGEKWNLAPTNASEPVVLGEYLEPGDDAAVVICLSRDIFPDVAPAIEAMGVRSYVVLGGDSGIGRLAVPDAQWLAGWARGARELLERKLRGRSRVHLFLAAPSSAALALGHLWNMLPSVVTYEWDPVSGSYLEDLFL